MWNAPRAEERAAPLPPSTWTCGKLQAAAAARPSTCRKSASHIFPLFGRRSAVRFGSGQSAAASIQFSFASVTRTLACIPRAVHGIRTLDHSPGRGFPSNVMVCSCVWFVWPWLASCGLVLLFVRSGWPRACVVLPRRRRRWRAGRSLSLLRVALARGRAGCGFPGGGRARRSPASGARACFVGGSLFRSFFFLFLLLVVDTRVHRC